MAEFPDTEATRLDTGTVETDPALVCDWCGYDNTPLPGDSAPEACEGCGGVPY